MKKFVVSTAIALAIGGQAWAADYGVVIQQQDDQAIGQSQSVQIDGGRVIINGGGVGDPQNLPIGATERARLMQGVGNYYRNDPNRTVEQRRGLQDDIQACLQRARTPEEMRGCHNVVRAQHGAH